MLLIDPLMAFVVVLPMVAVAVLVRMLGGMVKQAHRDDLDAASRVNGILRDLFQAAPVVVVHGAIDPVVAEVERRSEVRRATAVRNRVLDESIGAVSWSSGDVAVGLVLLVAAGSMRSGEFSVGDLALFLVYLDYLTFLPRMIGLVITRHRQADVAFDRMEELIGGGRATVARPRPVSVRSAREVAVISRGGRATTTSDPRGAGSDRRFRRRARRAACRPGHPEGDPDGRVRARSAPARPRC